MKVTSGYNFEGFRIVDYCGFCSGQAVLGTGFLSSLEAGFADIFGASSSTYENKLNDARRFAMQDLQKRAQECGGNAVIGVDVDFTIFSADIIGVIANGTAVKIEPIQSAQKQSLADEIWKQQIPVVNYDLSLNFRPGCVLAAEKDHKLCVKLLLKSYGSVALQALQVRMSFYTRFEEWTDETILNFGQFQKNSDLWESEEKYVDVPADLLSVIAAARVGVVKYVINDCVSIPKGEDTDSQCSTDQLYELKEYWGIDAVETYQTEPDRWICVCGKVNSHTSKFCALCGRKQAGDSDVMSYEQMLEKASALESAREIFEFCSKEGILPTTIAGRELLEQLEKTADAERAYGNMKRSALVKIQRAENALKEG